MLRFASSLLAALALVACAGEIPGRTLRLPEYGLTLELPASWQVQESSEGLRLFARPVGADGAVVRSAYFTLTRDDRRTGAPLADLENYVQFKERQAQHHVARYERLAQDRASLGGVLAVRQERLYASRTQEKRALVLMAVAGDHGYTFVGAAAPRDYATLRPQFERVLASIRWQ